ncbi:MAG: ATP-binding protein [Acidobacteriota bacterium]
MLSLRHKLFLYLIVVHVAAAVATVVALGSRPAWLLLAEALFVVSAWVGVRLLRALFAPLDLVRSSADLLGERDFSSTLRPVGQPDVDALIAVYNRMLLELRDERLRQKEQSFLLERILDASPAGVVTLDFAGAVSLVNPQAEKLLGATLIGRPLAGIPRVGAELAGLARGASIVVSLPAGRRLKVARAEYFDRGFGRSVFVLEEFTEELQASERAAYGKLIRMMSHEVNNSVGAVSSLLESLASFSAGLPAAAGEEFGAAIAVSRQRLERLRAFTCGFADVVRLPAPDLRPCDVAQLLRELVLLFQRGWRQRGIDCTLDLEAGLPAVALDRNQLEQVLVNVFKNAEEAMVGDDEDAPRSESDSERRIEITLRREGSDHRQELRIRDHGPGLSRAAREALFTPFFSTKRDGRGLGLTLVREILSRHGFDFALENLPAGGAEFCLVLESAV